MDGGRLEASIPRERKPAVEDDRLGKAIRFHLVASFAACLLSRIWRRGGATSRGHLGHTIAAMSAEGVAVVPHCEECRKVWLPADHKHWQPDCAEREFGHAGRDEEAAA
jgi:hypothetical protein